MRIGSVNARIAAMEIIRRVEAVSDAIDDKVRGLFGRSQKRYYFGSEDGVDKITLHISPRRSLVYDNQFYGTDVNVRELRTDWQKNGINGIAGKVEDFALRVWRGADRRSRGHANIGLRGILIVSMLSGGGAALGTAGLIYTMNDAGPSVAKTTVSTGVGTANESAFREYQLINSFNK